MTMSLHASLRAELLLAEGRAPLERVLKVGGEHGEVLELGLPDGTVNRAVVLPRAGKVSGLLVMSDQAVQVRVGAVGQNAPLTLRPWGIYALLDGDIEAPPCALSYTPGDGSMAQVVVLVLAQEYVALGCVRFLAHATLMQQFAFCWDLDEASGNRVDHISGNILVEDGPVATQPGKTGLAVTFPGYPTNSILRATSPGFFFQPPFTVAFWTRLSAYPTLESAAFIGNGASLNAGAWFAHINMHGFSHLIGMAVGSGAVAGNVQHPVVISLHAWHLVVAWHTGTACGIQIDNDVIAMAPGTPVSPAFFSLTIGGMDRTYGLPGAMDMVMIWSRALTAEERADVWNAGRG